MMYVVRPERPCAARDCLERLRSAPRRGVQSLSNSLFLSQISLFLSQILFFCRASLFFRRFYVYTSFFVGLSYRTNCLYCT